MASRSSAHSMVLTAIGVFKLFKGVLLVAVGIGALRLLNKDVAAEVYRWANAFRVDPGNRYLQLLLERLSIVNEKTLKEFSVGTLFYSTLFLIEGTGLLLGKHWAEYFTIIVTGSAIPLEIYELIRRATYVKGIVLVLNVAIVAYLAMTVRRSNS